MNVPVHQGDSLAVKAKRISFMYCSGGSGILYFEPPLQPGGSFRKGHRGDCLLLLEAIYK